MSLTARKPSDTTLWALMESVPDAMVTVDGKGAIVAINAQAEQLFACRRDEVLGEPLERLIPEPMWTRRIAQGLEAAFPAPVSAPAEVVGRRGDDTEFPIEISLSPLKTEGGPLLCCAIRDISERRRTERDLAYFRAMVESSHDAIIGKDLDGIVTSWNAGAERLFGYRDSEVRGRSISVLVPAGHDDDLPELLRRVRNGERVDDYEAVRARKDGTQIDVSLTLSPILDEQGHVAGVSTIARDITARLHYREQLRFLAEHDPLTGARNRRRFEQDISDQISRSRRYKEQAALLFLDVDGFKQINDHYGHRTGDQALKAIVAALNRRLRQADIVARVGGDEFCVLLPYAGATQAHAIAEDLRRVISDTFPNESRTPTEPATEPPISASIGVVEINEHTTSVEEVMAAADRAMYRSKADAALRDIGPISLSILRQQLP